MSDDNIEILRGPSVATKFAAGDDGVIEGYLARYNETDAHDEVFVPGVFRDSLHEIKSAGHRLPLLWQHDQQQPIGSWHELAEVPEGLWGTARINTETARGREALSLIRKGDLSGLSVGFAEAVRHGRTISRARLMECSVVSIPAASRARIKLKDVGSVPELVEALVAGRVGRRDVELVVRKSWAALSGSPDEPTPEQRETLARLDERIAAATRELMKGF